MKKLEVLATRREDRGKEKAKKARKSGMIPAVLYGKDMKNFLLYVSSKEFTGKLHKREAKSSIISLNVDGEKYNAILKEIQYHPFTYAPLHIDFHLIRMGQPVEVTVSVNLIGEPVGVKRGGILEFETRELDVKALPAKIPESIDVDVSELEIGYFVKVKDITPPKGVEILEAPETVIALVAGAEKEEVAATEEEEEKEGEEKEPEVISRKKEGEKE